MTCKTGQMSGRVCGINIFEAPRPLGWGQWNLASWHVITGRGHNYRSGIFKFGLCATWQRWPTPTAVDLLCPRPVRGGGGIKRWSASVVRLSVCLSDVAYIGSNSKTKRPRKTKLCTGVPQITCDSHTDFKVKRSKVKVTGSIRAPQRNVPIFRKWIKLRPSNLACT